MARASDVLTAFTEEHVLRLTGLSSARLRYWRRTGFFTPSAPEAAFGRFYSFPDVVALKTLRLLRDRHEVPLQHLRQVAAKLPHLGQHVWHRCTIYLLGRRVVLKEPGSTVPEEVVAGQYTLAIPLRRVADEARRDTKRLMERRRRQIGKVEVVRGVVGQAPILAGTRIPVAAIRNFADAGFSPEQIIREYPDLTVEDVRAALSYAPVSPDTGAGRRRIAA